MNVRRDALARVLLAAAVTATPACFHEQARRVGPTDAAIAPDARMSPADVAKDLATDLASDLAPDVAPDTGAARAPCRPPPDPDRPFPVLSATGCVDATDPLKPGPGLVFYDVASPLWSDGADKDRWVFIPAGSKVDIQTAAGGPGDAGHLQFPDGTVLVKNFSIGGQRIETRLITRSAAGWGSYSYRWTDDQTEAVVVGADEGSVARAVSGPAGQQIWTYPGRSDCTKCHTDEAGFQLGLTLVQLNHSVVHPDGTTRNQIDHWQAQGLFAGAPARPYPPALPSPTGAATLEARARSYLHANCANCHRPGSQNAPMDLRWTTALAATEACDVLPSKGDLGVAGARRIVPGQPGRSLISLRMHTLSERFRMPQIGTGVVDAAGARLVDDWIASLTGCATEMN